MKKKSTFAILAFLLGGLGIHRAYCGSYGMLTAGIIGVLTSIFFIGFFILSVTGIIAIVDGVRALTDEEFCKEWNLVD